MPFITDRYHDQNRNRQPAAPAAAPVASAPDTPAALAERLRSRVLGQEAAVEAVVRAITLARTGATEPDRPLATVLLLGPTGVGKTELVRQVATALRSGPDDLCRVDMNSLAQEHYAASFNGAPPGYAGSKEAFTVFDRSTVEGDPYAPGIVLFDEVEKAHPTVLRALLGVLDNGMLRLANGQEKISFRNSYVFLTSNLGSQELARRRGSRWRTLLDRGHARRTVVDKALRSFFDPEFLNRIDETVIFAELDRTTVEKVARLETDLLRARLRRRGVDLRVAESAVRFLADEGFDPVYGARGLRRTLRTHLAAPVAAEILRVRPTGTASLRITATAANGTIRAAATDPES
ncbi:AAA family ATPase [Amycolatopsis orientalis]|uniref:AAA family ATPase n=1 Tax=Amycolatopsis orientalis TaxID=31958 RepID=UPI0003A68C46|nr:AAA family ATPase [Amycolatopsis orientalis]